MKILFLHPNSPDYVGDGLFHGLRAVLESDVVDFPRMDYMYADYDKCSWKGVANEGKVLYGKLADCESLKARRNIWESEIGGFDLVIISQPYGFGNAILALLNNLRKAGAWKKLVWVDGSDGTAVFPYIHLRRGLNQWLAAFGWPMPQWLYFKREFNGVKHTAPSVFSFYTKRYRLQQISISIPSTYIERIDHDQKKQLFPNYIVDKEIAEEEGILHGALAARNFLFTDESSYFDDICKSKFGVTTRRSGWDALRHYEYAAKGAVICFRDLKLKHSDCAPFGLNETNCISYSNYFELKQRLALLSETEYRVIQENSYQWIANHTTVAEANRFLNVIANSKLCVS